MTDYETRLSNLTSQKARELSQLEQIRQQFLRVCSSFLASWFDQQAERSVEHEHLVTGALTDAQLRQLKQEVAILKNTAPAIVTELVGEETLWWHFTTDLPSEPFESHDYPWRYSYGSGQRSNDRLDDVLHLACGRLAAVLEPYGYLKKCAWRSQRFGEAAFYPTSLDWSKEMRRTIEGYASGRASVLQLIAEEKRLHADEAKRIARSRWDSIA